MTHTREMFATVKKNNISQFFSKSMDSISKKVIKAEVMVKNFFVQHNLPLATADHLGPLFKDIFTDSKIAESYMSGCTKTTAMLNLSMVPHCHSYLVDHCQSHPYSLGIDHLMVQTTLDRRNESCSYSYLTLISETVTSHFYMCVTFGEAGARAASIFDAVNNKFGADSMPWENAVSLSVDNANAMIGRNNSMASRCKNENPDIFISGCPCHSAHIAATEANDAFAEIIGINVEDVLIDLFYWFDKSSKCKGKLAEYFEFCDQEYHACFLLVALF